MKSIILNYILSRLNEASTWRGIIMLIAGGWATRNPDQLDAIIPVAMAIVGAVGAFIPDKNTTIKKETDDESSNINRGEPEPEPKPKAIKGPERPKRTKDSFDSSFDSSFGDK